jgi:probable DNA metabolism protein
MEAIYDGSFEGFLTLVFELFKSKENIEILKQADASGRLLFDSARIKTDEEKANRVASSLTEKLSDEVFHNILICFLSEETGIEVVLLEYIKKAFSLGADISNNFADETVKKVIDTRQKVLFEAHTMKGLLRFQMLKNEIYYAPFEPKYNITELIIGHFARRFRAQEFIIYDVSRNIAYRNSRREVRQMDLTEIYEIEKEITDDETASLWKKFYKTISIKERENPKLQARMMPKRYWKYLTEKENT